MSDITDIYERLSVGQLREFLLYGTENGEYSGKCDYQRLEDARRRAVTPLRQKYPDPEEFETITGEIYQYASQVQDVYMEIGMRCGAKLIVNLLTSKP